MDPLTASTAFASIVGLISIFNQERADRKTQSLQDFTRWLDEHKHEQMKEFILASHDVEREIDALLRQDHVEIIAKLEGMDLMLAAILGKVEGLGAIGQAIHPNSELSDQAVSILQQLVNSSAKEFGKLPHMQGVSMPLVPNGGEIAVDDFRFLDDDLQTLLDFGLLSLRVGSHGSEFYGVTRRAVKFIELVDGRRKGNE